MQAVRTNSPLWQRSLGRGYESISLTKVAMALEGERRIVASTVDMKVIPRSMDFDSITDVNFSGQTQLAFANVWSVGKSRVLFVNGKEPFVPSVEEISLGCRTSLHFSLL